MSHDLNIALGPHGRSSGVTAFRSECIAKIAFPDEDFDDFLIHVRIEFDIQIKNWNMAQLLLNDLK